MSLIANIHARQILDSRGNPTVEVDVITQNGFWVEQQYHLVLQPENTKHWSCETETS